LSDFNQATERLSHMVSSTESHIGIMIDPGGEKIYCVDENGCIISGERLSVLVTRLYLQCYSPEKIAVPVSIPAQIETLCSKKHVEVIHTATDGGAIIKATEDSKVLYAAGTKGGFVFSDFHFSFDGMFAAAKLLELMARTGRLLGVLDTEIPRIPYIKETLPCPWKSRGELMRRLIAHTEDEKRLLIDGVKLQFDNSWLLVLPDRNNALFHLIAEGPDFDEVRKILSEYTALLLSWIDENKT
jgi:mannose-1-phosphate guanylyltransferase/phosphomannomutase